MPLVTIKPDGTLYLPKAFMHALKLTRGVRIGLVPPPFGSYHWHLDLRPQALNPRAIDWTGSAVARIKGLLLPPGLVTAPLALYLLPGEPTYPNYYPLLPANAFTAQ